MQTLSKRVQNECNSVLKSEDELKIRFMVRFNLSSTLWKVLLVHQFSDDSVPKHHYAVPAWSDGRPISGSYCILQILIGIENLLFCQLLTKPEGIQNIL